MENELLAQVSHKRSNSLIHNLWVLSANSEEPVKGKNRLSIWTPNLTALSSKGHNIGRNSSRISWVAEGGK